MRIILAFLAVVTLGSFVRADDAAPPQSSREKFLKLIDRPRVPLNPEEKEMPAPAAGMVESHIAYSTEVNQRVPALVIKPADVKPGTRLPVVILLHGTGGKKENNLGLMKSLVAKGFMAVSPDGRYHGERTTQSGTKEYYAEIAKAFKDGQSHPWLYDTVFDVMRLIDYLETRPDVDPKRIGLMGFSKGGMETYLCSAADPRVAVSIPCIGVQTYRYGLENNQWKGRIGTVQGAADTAAKEAGVPIDSAFVKRFYDHVVPGIDTDFDGPAMLPLIAPRPLLVINGDSDDKTPLPGVLMAADAARAAYEKAGVPDHFVLKVQEKTGHKVNPDSTQQAIAWFEKWLMPK